MCLRVGRNGSAGAKWSSVVVVVVVLSCRPFRHRHLSRHLSRLLIRRRLLLNLHKARTSAGPIKRARPNSFVPKLTDGQTEANCLAALQLFV